MNRIRLAVALALASAATGCSASAAPGPLFPAHLHGFSVTVPVGHTYTDGMEVLELRGHQNAVIDSVRLVPGKNGDGIKLLGVQVASPARTIGGVQEPGWPVHDRHIPPSTLRPADGAIIKPGHRGWELLLGLKATRPGYLVRRGVIVKYHVGDQHYVWRDPAWGALCTWPRGAKPCPAPSPHGPM